MFVMWICFLIFFLLVFGFVKKSLFHHAHKHSHIHTLIFVYDPFICARLVIHNKYPWSLYLNVHTHTKQTHTHTQINALVSALISSVLLLISLLTDYWLTATDVKQGLWRNCTLASSLPSLAYSIRAANDMNNFFICVPINKVCKSIFWFDLIVLCYFCVLFSFCCCFCLPVFLNVFLISNN